MKQIEKGEQLLAATLTVHPVKVAELAAALGSGPNAMATASIGLFFGPTVVGYRRFVDAIDLDLDRALLGGHETTWRRPFAPNEKVEAAMTMVEYSEKNGMEIGVFETTFSTPDGQLIQAQRTTFIERPRAARN